MQAWTIDRPDKYCYWIQIGGQEFFTNCHLILISEVTQGESDLVKPK